MISKCFKYIKILLIGKKFRLLLKTFVHDNMNVCTNRKTNIWKKDFEYLSFNRNMISLMSTSLLTCVFPGNSSLPYHIVAIL